MRSLVAPSSVLALVSVLAGCGDDAPFAPTTENVAGSYSATTFTVATATGTVDLLALGSEVDVTLSSDGTTTGRLFVPASGEVGEDVEADLTGTWALDGSTVTFDQEGDTFLRDVEFTATRNRLTADGTFGNETVRLVLAKSD